MPFSCNNNAYQTKNKEHFYSCWILQEVEIVFTYSICRKLFSCFLLSFNSFYICFKHLITTSLEFATGNSWKYLPIFGHWHEKIRIKHSHAAFYLLFIFPSFDLKMKCAHKIGSIKFSYVFTHIANKTLRLLSYFCVNIISFLKIYARMLCLHILCIGFESRD